MLEYRELYASNGLTLLGTVDNYSTYIFRIELKFCDINGLDCSFSGAASFCFPPQREEEYYCNEFRKMYDSLQGQCAILDNGFGNELKLFFVGRQLKIEGRFSDAVQQLQFSGDVDQTIIPNIISLFKRK